MLVFGCLGVIYPTFELISSLRFLDIHLHIFSDTTRIPEEQFLTIVLLTEVIQPECHALKNYRLESPSRSFLACKT